MLTSAALVFGLGAVFGVIFTRLGRGVAMKLRLQDAPDGRRKVHARPVAVVGGLALLFAVPATLFAASLLWPDVATAFAERQAKWIALGTAAILLAVVGVLDDVCNLRARYKLLGQLFAIAVLIVGSDSLYLIQNITAFGTSIPLGAFAVPFTIAWFLFAVNALNLLDGMDGMLGAVGTTIFLGLAAMAAIAGSNFAVLVAVAAAGGLVGFLRYNLPPATVYLGDCGSMLIGLTIATLAVDASLKGPAFAVLAPAALMVLPVLDTVAAIIRRKLTGRGLAIGDRGHLHHVLMRHGYSIPRVLVMVGLFGSLAAVGAVSSSFWNNDLIALLAAGLVVVTLMVGGLFGAAELRLIRARAGSVIRKATGRTAVDLEVRLQGSHAWGTLWDSIVNDARFLNLSSVCLDVNAPAWHEGYHRRWRRAGAAEDPLTVWRVELPLLAAGHLVGRLTVSGERAEGCMAEKLAALSAVVRSAEVLLASATSRRLEATTPTAVPSEFVPDSPLTIAVRPALPA